MNSALPISPGTTPAPRVVRPATVLIVEDSPVQAELLRRSLDEAGHAVVIAKDGQEALALARAQPPDAVVSDVNMPIMDGFTLCREIRADERLQRTPVVLVTTLSDPLDLIRGLNAGADAYVTKPYNIPTLVSRIESLVSHPPEPPPRVERRKVEVQVAGRTHVVEANGQRALNLLISTYENAVVQNHELTATHQALEDLNQHLEQRVTEQSEALLAGELRYRGLFEKMDQGFCVVEMIWDADGRAADYCFVETNPAFERHTGLHDALHSTIRQMVPDHDEHWFEVFAKVALTGESIRFQSPATAMQRYYDVFAFRVDGKDVSKVGILFNDITERRRVEAKILELNATLEQRVTQRTTDLEAANKELESFSYSVSHDLRAPLRAIDGFSAMLLEDYAGKLDAEGQGLLGNVRRNAEKMGKLIDDILQFSRAGRGEIERVDVDVAALIRKILPELLPPPGERRIDVRVGDLPHADADRNVLRQVLVNLLSNAIKFTRPRPTATIEISGSSTETETEYAIRDNGVGFDPAFANKLFGVFQRLHSVEAFPGTGIGLSIVKRFIDKHGGHVWAESQLGQGATFHFSLPKRATLLSAAY